jgi:hypothetical protein
MSQKKIQIISLSRFLRHGGENIALAGEGDNGLGLLLCPSIEPR